MATVTFMELNKLSIEAALFVNGSLRILLNTKGHEIFSLDLKINGIQLNVRIGNIIT